LFQNLVLLYPTQSLTCLQYGYPSAFVIESDFEYSDKKIHTSDDTIQYLSFGHMLQHAKMTLGFAYEMAFAKF
jgi:bacterial leucyl aminopeptidase